VSKANGAGAKRQVHQIINWFPHPIFYTLHLPQDLTSIINLLYGFSRIILFPVQYESQDISSLIKLPDSFSTANNSFMGQKEIPASDQPSLPFVNGSVSKSIFIESAIMAIPSNQVCPRF